MRNQGETVGDRLVRLAKEVPELRGLTQVELAAAFGVVYETLRKWKSGSHAPNRNRAAYIAEVLGVPPEVFMHGVEFAGRDEAEGATPAPTRAIDRNRHPDLSRLTAYYLELGPDEQAAVMADLHARAARVVGARALLAATGYEPPAPVETHALSPEALRLATHFDHLNPEARKLAFAMAEAQLVKASQRFEVAPTDDAPAAPAATKPRPVRS